MHHEVKKATPPMKHKMIVTHDATIEVDDNKVEIVDVESINLEPTSKQPTKGMKVIKDLKNLTLEKMCY